MAPPGALNNPVVQMKFIPDIKVFVENCRYDSLKQSFRVTGRAMSMRSALPVFVLGILTSGIALRPAVAVTAGVSFGVSATVQASCRASANAAAFRTFAAAAANTTSLFSVTCSNSAPYNVSVSAGMGSRPDVAIREMPGFGTALLGLPLSSNPQGILNRGQTVGADMVAGVGDGSAQVLAGHDPISAGQYAAAGAYADTIIVTVTY